MTNSDQTDPPGPQRPKVLLLWGPNFNLLGKREPNLYGSHTLDDVANEARTAADQAGLDFDHLQSNNVADLVEAIHRAREAGDNHADAIVINPGAFTHYAWALTDALAAFGGPIIEVHQTNTASRESWRHTSVISPVATATLAGLGDLSYTTAVIAAAAMLAKLQRG